MTNYSKAKIYEIRNDSDNRTYIGSTCNSLKTRFDMHKYDARKTKCSRRKLVIAINELGFSHFSIHLIEKFPCHSLKELRTREDRIIKRLKPALNMNRALYTREIHDQVCTAYRERNPNHDREYYQTNKAMLKLKAQELITCHVCNREVQRYKIRRHERTQLHLNNLA